MKNQCLCKVMISDELVIAGKLQLKQLQKLKHEKKFRQEIHQEIAKNLSIINRAKSFCLCEIIDEKSMPM